MHLFCHAEGNFEKKHAFSTGLDRPARAMIALTGGNSVAQVALSLSVKFSTVEVQENEEKLGNAANGYQALTP